MKSSPPLLALLLFATTAVGQGTGPAGGLSRLSEDRFEPLSRIPVNITNRTGGANQSVELIGVEGDSLVVQIEEGTLLIPKKNNDLRLDYVRPEEYFEGAELYREGEYERASEIMEEIAEPLLQYIDIPERSFNIHGIVLNYYRALVKGGMTDKAFSVAVRLPPYALEHGFLEPTVSLIRKLVEEGQTNRALTILSAVYGRISIDRFYPIAIEIADQFRALEDYEAAQNVYYTFHDSARPEYKRNSLLWSAYCQLKRGRSSLASLLMDSVGPVQENDDLYPVTLLVNGIRALQQDRTNEALKLLSEGNVGLEVTNRLKPEFSFHVANAYLQQGQIEPARYILDEQETFFPENIWTTRLRDILTETESSDT